MMTPENKFKRDFCLELLDEAGCLCCVQVAKHDNKHFSDHLAVYILFIK